MVALPPNSGFQPRIVSPPGTGQQALDHWLRDLTGIVNSMPRLSWFSGTHPNLSHISGTAGDLCINLASSSTATRLWLMGGAPSYSTYSGWLAVQVTPLP